MPEKLRKPVRLAAMPLPQYHRIYLVLRERLIEGRYPPGAALPSEFEFASAFGVSRVTVRAALDRLSDEKLIVRQRGRGTFPVPPGDGQAHGTAHGVLENIMDRSLKTTVKVLSLEYVTASPDVAERLHLAKDAVVQKVFRVLSLDGEPISCLTSFVPKPLARAITRRKLQTKPMVLLLEEGGVKIGNASQTLSASLADHSVAPLLNVAIGSPLLAVNRTVFSVEGSPVQYLRGLYRPDRYEYQMHLSRVGTAARIWVTQNGSR